MRQDEGRIEFEAKQLMNSSAFGLDTPENHSINFPPPPPPPPPLQLHCELI